MSVFAFSQLYDKKKVFNYPSFRINLKTEDVKTKQFIFQIDEYNYAKSLKYDLKFPLSLSACIFNNETYLFGNLVESIFGFENSLKEQMSDAMKAIEKSSIFDTKSSSDLSSFASKGRNYYCYSNFDKNKLDALKYKNV